MSKIKGELSLAQLPLGKRAVIRSLVDNELSLKLMEMGCLPGETVQVTAYAPAGDPIAVSISGYILSLRLDEATSVLLETE